MACIVLALCALAFSPRAAHAAVGDYGTLEDGTYTVTALLSAWMNWDVTSGSTSNEAKVQSYHHNGTAAQIWKITTDSDGYSTIINVGSGKALDVPEGTVANGKQLQQYTPNGTKAQKWKIIERSDAYKICSAVDETYYIDLADGSTSSGAAIQLWTEGSPDNQRWHIDKVADQTTTILSDQTKLFDTSVYVTDTQAGTITWETVPDGWEVVDYVDLDNPTAVKALKYKSGTYYPGGTASAALRVDKCCKVNGKWASIRLTFSNLAGHTYLENDRNGCYIALRKNDLWQGIDTARLAQMDMKIELFDTESGDAISLKGAYLSGASLNNHDIQQEGIRYLADETFESYLLKGHGLKVCEDGIWRGSSALDNLDWDDYSGGDNFIVSCVGFRIMEDKPTYRLYLAQLSNDSSHTKIVFNLSPLTIATPPSPTKSVEITE